MQAIETQSPRYLFCRGLSTRIGRSSVMGLLANGLKKSARRGENETSVPNLEECAKRNVMRGGFTKDVALTLTASAKRTESSSPRLRIRRRRGSHRALSIKSHSNFFSSKKPKPPNISGASGSPRFDSRSMPRHSTMARMDFPVAA